MGDVLGGRRVLITGAASGIGLAIAREFAAAGARVALIDRSTEGLQQAVAEIGDRAIGLQADVSNPHRADTVVSEAVDALGGLDGVVNSAGISLWRAIEDTTYQDWRNVLSINLDGPFLICRAAIPALRQAGGGTIVNIASGSSLRPTGKFGAYCTSKAGLLMLTKVLAIELVGSNIRANAICPGVIYTAMVEGTLAASPNREQRTEEYLARQGMKRFGSAEEIAKLALFLTGPDSSFTTGSAYSADGGSVFH